MRLWIDRAARRLAEWVLRLTGRFPVHTAVAAFALPWGLLASSSRSRMLWTPAVDVYIFACGAGSLICVVAVRGQRKGSWASLMLTFGAFVNFIVADFAYWYWSLSAAQPSSFSEPLTKTDASYFAWATTTTTGFGDVVPLSEPARLATTVQMVLTFVLVGVGLGLLIGAAPRGGPTSSGRSSASVDD